MKTMQFTKLSSVLVLSSALFISACSESETEVKEEAAAAQEVVTEQALPQVAEQVESVVESAQEVVEEAAEAVEETAEEVQDAAEEAEETAAEEAEETNNAE